MLQWNVRDGPMTSAKLEVDSNIVIGNFGETQAHMQNQYFRDDRVFQTHVFIAKFRNSSAANKTWNERHKV